MACGSEEGISMKKRAQRGRIPKKRKHSSNSSTGHGRLRAVPMKIHAYLLREFNSVEKNEKKSAECIDRICQITLEAFWRQKLIGKETFERTDGNLEGLGLG